MAKKIRLRAKVRCTHPITGRYCYPNSEDTFTVGKGCQLEEIPKHWEEVPLNESTALPEISEVENLLEAQIKGMSAGRIVQYIYIYYGIKLESGQAKETAFQQAIQIIRDPSKKKLPTSTILNGLSSLDDTAKKEQPAAIPSGNSEPVVPAKEELKPFKNLTPDEIEDMPRAEIFTRAKKMYNVDIQNVGSKTVVLGRALEAEATAMAVKEINEG